MGITRTESPQRNYLVSRRTCVTTTVFAIEPTAPKYADVFDNERNIFHTSTNSDSNVLPLAKASGYDLQGHLNAIKYQGNCPGPSKLVNPGITSGNYERQIAPITQKPIRTRRDLTSGCYEPD